MSQNINSGYGQHVQSHVFRGGGQVFVVAKTAQAGRQILQDTFRTDTFGKARFAATIDAAVNQCTANRNDVIYVAPGHTENISSATALNLDVAGVSIVGLGSGSLRPTLTFDTATAATIAVSANNVTVENLIFSADFADIAAAVTLTTAKYFTLRGCRIEASATGDNFLAVIETNTTDNAADGLVVEDCVWIEPDTATTSMINVDGDLDGLIFRRNYLNLGVNTSDLPAIAEVATGKDLTNAQIGGKNASDGNVVIRLNDANPLLITANTTTANTGFVANNYVRHLDTAGELLVTAGTNFGFFDNKATAAVDKSGYLLPAADS